MKLFKIENESQNDNGEHNFPIDVIRLQISKSVKDITHFAQTFTVSEILSIQIFNR